MAKPNVNMKLLIDKSTNKVLFAEAGKDTVDFLFNLLVLPLSTVVNLLGKPKMVGCIANLYESVESLGKDYIQPNQNKNTLLKPKVLIKGSPLLMINSGSNPDTKKLYRCNYKHCARSYNEISYISNSKCSCGHFRVIEMEFADDDVGYNSSATQAQGVSEEGGFVKGVITYMVMDNLVVKPMSTISSIALLNKFSIKDVGALEEKIVNVNMEMALMLLKESLNSTSVLTTVFLGGK